MRMRQKGAPKSSSEGGAVTSQRYSLLADGIAGTGSCQNIKCSKSDVSLSFGVCRLRDGKKKMLALCSDCKVLAHSRKTCVGCEEFYHDKEAGLWVQCTEVSCQQWSHILCVSNGAIGRKSFMCMACETKQTLGKDINFNLVKAAKKSMTKTPRPSDSVSVKRKAEPSTEESAKKPKTGDGGTQTKKSPSAPLNIPCEIPLCSNKSAVHTLKIRDAQKLTVCDRCLDHVDSRSWCPVCYQVYLKDDKKAWIGCEHKKCCGWVHAECAQVSMDVTEVDCPHCGKGIPITDEDKRMILKPNEALQKSKCPSNSKASSAEVTSVPSKALPTPKVSAPKTTDVVKLKKLKEIENQELEAASKSLFDGQAPASRRSSRLAENTDWMLARRIQEKEMSRAFSRPLVTNATLPTSSVASKAGTGRVAAKSQSTVTREPPSQKSADKKGAAQATKGVRMADGESKPIKKEEGSGSNADSVPAVKVEGSAKAPTNGDIPTLAFDCLLDSSERAGGLRALDKKKIRTAVKACAKDVRNFLVKKLRLPADTRIDVLHKGRLLLPTEKLQPLAPAGEKLVVTYRSSVGEATA